MDDDSAARPGPSAEAPGVLGDDTLARWRALTPSGEELRFQDFLTFKLGRLHSLVHREITPTYLDASGLSLPEWRVLARLGGYESLEMRQLTRINLMDKAAISRTTDSLMAKGYVGRHVDPVHATRRIVALTPAGRRLLRKVMPLAQREQAALLGLLDIEEREVLGKALDKLVGALLARGEDGAAAVQPRPAVRHASRKAARVDRP